MLFVIVHAAGMDKRGCGYLLCWVKLNIDACIPHWRTTTYVSTHFSHVCSTTTTMLHVQHGNVNAVQWRMLCVVR